MDFDLPPDDDPRRVAIREWLHDRPQPTGRDLHAAGFVVPHWPPPYGRGADPIEQLIIDDEFRRAGVADTPAATNPIGVGWAAPTILLTGSEWQRERFLDPILRGDEFWCQLFSEPDAGSDLASLRTSAVRDGDVYVIDGTKIWSSGAHHADYGILLARTDSTAPKHRGISYFILPMDLPGVSVRPIVDMSGGHTFNETVLDGVRVPADHRVGAEGDGWRLAKMTLANERVSLSSGGALWGAGPTASDLLACVRASGGEHDPVMRQRLARLHTEAEILRLTRLRSLSARARGRSPGPEASIQKILGDEHGQHVMDVAKRLAGSAGMLAGSGPVGADGAIDAVWHRGFLFAPALTIGGGTFAIQRNIVAEHVLGLPREPQAS